MTELIKIAFTGKARSGKDYIAEEISERGLSLYRFAFGDELKRHASHIFPQQFEGDAKPRQLIQQFGQMMRKIDEDVWVRPVIDRIRYYENVEGWSDHFDGFVVTDLRQPNEYAALKAEGFTIIRINAPDDVRMQRMIAAGDAFSYDDLLHETETHIDRFDVDYELMNDGRNDAVTELLDFIGGT